MADTNKPAEGKAPEANKTSSTPAPAEPSVNEEGKPVDAKGNPVADPSTATPGTARTVNSEVLNTDGEVIEVVTRVNARPNPTPASPEGNENRSNQDPEMFKSEGEPIPSIVIKRFYDDNGALVREDARYTYIPKKGLPYPWPLMRPVDEGQAGALKKQYDEFMVEKRAGIRERQDRRTALDRLLRS
jgi:hypothetical protein